MKNEKHVSRIPYIHYIDFEIKAKDWVKKRKKNVDKKQNQICISNGFEPKGLEDDRSGLATNNFPCHVSVKW